MEWGLGWQSAELSAELWAEPWAEAWQSGTGSEGLTSTELGLAMTRAVVDYTVDYTAVSMADYNCLPDIPKQTDGHTDRQNAATCVSVCVRERDLLCY